MIQHSLYEKQQTKDGYDYYVPVDIEKLTFYGKTLEEIAIILKGLEIEKLTEVTLCMKNLKLYQDMLDKNVEEMIRRSVEKTFKENIELGENNR